MSSIIELLLFLCVFNFYYKKFNINALAPGEKISRFDEKK